MKENAIEPLIQTFLEYLEIEKNASKLTTRNYRLYLTRFSDWLSPFGKSIFSGASVS